MRLLNTTSYVSKEFDDSEVPPYGILSHRWRDEITFQDVGQINDGAGDGYKKVREACSIAREYGFEYIWIDTCCIDKTSSTELSEAINSMYRWYEESGVCFTYLDDVPSKDISKSEWFTRGWTLQELIAPSVVIFLDETWEEIGTKFSLRKKISDITRIPEDILQGGDLQTASIAQRMSWASNRETKRIEDIAYCLMGIFGVNMPMLYGEGGRAFIRLQEEIMKISHDHSLFAWRSREDSNNLLATSPAAFGNSGNILPADSFSSEAILMDSKGIHLKVRFMDIERSPSQNIRLAILPCAVRGDSKRVGVYMEAIAEAKQHFMRARIDRLELINIDESRLLKYENICVQQQRHTHKNHVPLVAAARNGFQVVVKLLLEKGASSIEEPLAERALVSAAGKGHEAVVKLLMEKLMLKRDASNVEKA